MMSPDVDEIIESANNLLSSIYRDFDISISPDRRLNSSVLTVSPEVRREIDNIERYIAGASHTLDEVQELSASQGGDSVIISESTPISRRRGQRQDQQQQQQIPVEIVSDNVSASSQRRRQQQHSTVEIADVIDLCSDSPEVNVRMRSNVPQPTRVSVVDLVSPRNLSRRRRNRLTADCSGFETPPNKQVRSPERAANTTSDLICAICMENYSTRKPTATKCGHVFCYMCIIQSLQLSSQCPICRTKISKRNLIRIHL